MRIFYFHYDVGSGIEFAGNQFEKWIKEITDDVIVHKEQNCAWHQMRFLTEAKPDLIILNELYESSIEATLYYKIFKPQTRVILMPHVWRHLLADRPRMKELLRVAESIYCINLKPDDVTLGKLDGKFHNFGYPVDDKEYKIKVPWNERPHMFGYFGNILPHKVSHRFARINTIPIDMYGRIFEKDDLKEYYEDLFKSQSITYKLFAKQEDMPDILNQYKYFVMPHDGYEPFNVTLLQAIKCGVIPLISTENEHNWLHWATGLFFGCKDESELLYNMAVMDLNKPDMSGVSRTISKMANKVFNYDEMKNVLQKIINSIDK
jgi:glycosyltransferase involved in cell wall biosynthesis